MCVLVSFHKSLSFPLTNADSMNFIFSLILLLAKECQLYDMRALYRKGEIYVHHNAKLILLME